MKRLVQVLWWLSLFACKAPQPLSASNPCSKCDVADQVARDSCIAECLADANRHLRFNSNDWVVQAPRFWLFYEDLAARLPPLTACGNGVESFGNLRPLWRRVLPGGRGTSGPVYDGRSSTSISHGRLATNIGPGLWLMDATTGDVQHAFAGNWRASDIPEEMSAGADGQFAAFTPDGDALWEWEWGVGPVLTDLRHVDPLRGTRTVFAAEFDRTPDGGEFGSGIFPSAAIAPDGTFYWGGSGGTYAMTTGRQLEVAVAREPAVGSSAQGELNLGVTATDVAHAAVKWNKSNDELPVGGRQVIDEDGTVYWPSGAAMTPDSSIKWQASPPLGWTLAYGDTTEVERPGRRFYWPMVWEQLRPDGRTATGEVRLVAHSLRDGSILWVRNVPNIASSQNQKRESSFSAQGSDGTLYLATRPYDPSPNLDHGYIEARDGGTGDVMWRVELPAADGPDGGPLDLPSTIMGGPVPSPSGDGVYVASRNCKLYHIDRSGQIVAWYKLAGQAIWDIPQLVDGTLYVIAEANRDLADAGDMDVCPYWAPQAAERYGCELWPQCGPCAPGGNLLYLYAFKVE